MYTTVSSLKQVASFSSFGENGYCLNKVQKMTKYPFFKFTPNSGDVYSRKDTVQFLVGATLHEQWTDHRTNNHLLFLKFSPSSASTAPEELTEPSYFDYMTG